MAAAESLSALSGYGWLAEVRAGGDGDPYGASEYDLLGASEPVEGRTTWDDDLEDGFDSGNVLVGLRVRADGDARFSVADASTGDLTTEGPTSSIVDKVIVRLGVQGAQMQAMWSNLTVSFYRNGLLRESLSISAPASALGTEEAPVQEELLTFMPTDADDDEVVITGAVRLLCAPENVQPDANAIFSQILVYGG
jgi:hypothetical protein